MAKSNMDQDILKVLLTEEEIKARVEELGSQLYDRFAGKDPLFVGVLNGCFIFMADLVRAAQLKSELEFIGLSSYQDGTKSSGVVQITRDLQSDITNRDIIVVEDILDSGNTLAFLKAYLMTKGARSVTIVTLLDKPSRRKADIRADYAGFEVEDAFVVGYGLDYAEKYRNPVMILIDGVIGVMMEPIELPDMVSDEFLAENNAKKKAEYAVGPRDGRTEKHPLNVSDGGPMGRNHADWMKYEGWKENEVEYELYKTDDADLIISAYGISARIAKSAISILRNEGYKVGLIRPKRVYPFPVKPFAELCPDKIKGILDVEMSMPPQLLEDVAAATKGAIPIDTCLTSYGVIMNRDDIVAKAKEMLK
mgnify:CR=1 FL=1